MSRKKDISILLFVLIGCAVIALASPIAKTEKSASPDVQNKNKEVVRQFPAFVEKTEPPVNNLSVSDYYRIFKNEDAAEPEPSKEENIKNEPLAAISQNKTANADSGQKSQPSLENILAEIEKIANKIKIDFGEKTCDSCGGQAQSETSGIPTCADILAAGAGACNCATLGCTPPDPPWCVHPCCCVCCPVCCR